MVFEKIKNKGEARLFRSSFLETMTKTHPIVIYSIYLPLIVYLLYRGCTHNNLSVIAELGFFGGGVLFWSFFEYMMHRYIFHMIVENPKALRIVYTIHGVHHKFPRDKNRLFMPPVPSILIASIIYFIFHAIMGKYALAFFPGFVFGYLVYGSMHYAIHAFAPPKFLKALWRNHHLHHYKYPDKGFGVSSVLWDILFGTVPQKEG